jgi:endonuclease G, mitochondrial
VFAVEQLVETEQRYQARTEDRLAADQALAEGGILYGDSPERVRRRLARLAAPAPPVVGVEPGPPSPDLIGLERLIGVSNFIDARFLRVGAVVARTVARILVKEASGLILEYGTGFLVGPGLLLTNNHVLETPAQAAASAAEFGYEQDLTGRVQVGTNFGFDPDTLFVTDPTLDYTLVAVQPDNGAGATLSGLGWSRLVRQEGKAIRGEFVNIIQHPGGQPKALALRDNQLVDVLERFVHYHTDTAPGSSGAPVYNDQWEVIALHHSGVPRRNPAGQILTRSGDPWTPAMDETQIDWIANEGARVSRILAHLATQPLAGAAARLRAELLAAPLPPVVDEQAAPTTAANGPATMGPTIAADGTLTLTVPLQLSLRLGGGPSPTALSPAAVPPPAPAIPAPVAAVPVVAGPEVEAALGALAEAATRPYYDAASDQADQAAYYQAVPAELTPTQRFAVLAELVRTSHATTPGYRPVVELYPWVDLHRDLKLRAIYSDAVLEPARVILEDVRIETERATRLASAGPEALDALEAELRFNCEHVVPQSWFAKAEPMRGDLHHLFACEPRCNSFRGNIPYFDFADFPDLEVIRDQCGRRETNRFEPQAGKGPVARATLYFLLRYPDRVQVDELPTERLAVLLDWHNQFPPGEYEQHRNAAIFARQGNRNPLIDHPEWAPSIDFTSSLTS